jgi:secondary thiamine-phosphate synthase enzyme
VTVFREEQTLHARGRGLHRIDAVIDGVLHRSKVQRGLCSIFVQHTSASIILQENADP